MHGCLSYFKVRTPTHNEIDTCLNLTATAENIEWNPYSQDFAKQKLSYDTVTRILMVKRALNYIFSQEHEMIYSIQANISAMKSSNPQLHAQPEELAQRWAVGKTMAENMIQATTKKFIRSALHPIDRRYRTKNLILKYNSLYCSFTSNTFLLQLVFSEKYMRAIIYK
jgi:hypothetical protein